MKMPASLDGIRASVRMANTRIILLSDGTGNSAGKVWRGNVWTTLDAFDLPSSQQIAFLR
jgi:hypothetical protein